MLNPLHAGACQVIGPQFQYVDTVYGLHPEVGVNLITLMNSAREGCCRQHSCNVALSACCWLLRTCRWVASSARWWAVW
jgi:hypothetical protein